MARSSDFQDRFSHAAPSYAAFRPSYPRELAESLAALAPSRALAWDVGAGSGQLSTLLAESFERVIATDASREQLSHAIRHPRVEYRVEREAQSSLSDASVELITAAQAAHWFDLPAFYAEVRRVAKPRAIVALITYRTARLEPELTPLFERFYAGVLGPHWDPARRHVENGYAEFAFPFEELRFPALAIEAELDLRGLLGYVSTWSALASLVRAGGASEFERFERELGAAWGPPDRHRPIEWPLAGRLGRM
ncbi:MAG: methyltransferase domain-containing protein [Planctomycetes bacterium]|nr:methyltransferase domain-containing protein [Planctomycetota bacterium]